MPQQHALPDQPEILGSTWSREPIQMNEHEDDLANVQVEVFNDNDDLKRNDIRTL